MRLATFMVSGIAHELVCSVVFRKLSLYFFLGMVVQLPLQLVSKYFENTRVGNMIMWVSLFLGQPLLEVRRAGRGVSVVVLLPRLVPAVPKPILLTFFWLFVGNTALAVARLS